MQVTTNNVWRYTVDPHELNAVEREQFDYMDWNALDSGEDSATFFRYRGDLYDLAEFTVAPSDLAGWDGVLAQGFYFGLVVKIDADADAVVVGQYCV